MLLHYGYYYYDYVVIGVLRPSWFTEIFFSIGLLLSNKVKQLKIIIIIIFYSVLHFALMHLSGYYYYDYV